MNTVFSSVASAYPWSGIVVAFGAMVVVGLVLYLPVVLKRRRK